MRWIATAGLILSLPAAAAQGFELGGVSATAAPAIRAGSVAATPARCRPSMERSGVGRARSRSACAARPWPWTTKRIDSPRRPLQPCRRRCGAHAAAHRRRRDGTQPASGQRRSSITSRPIVAWKRCSAQVSAISAIAGRSPVRLRDARACWGSRFARRRLGVSRQQPDDGGGTSGRIGHRAYDRRCPAAQLCRRESVDERTLLGAGCSSEAVTPATAGRLTSFPAGFCGVPATPGFACSGAG